MRRSAAIALSVLAIAMSPAFAAQHPPAETASALSTPELIERDVATGELDRVEADLLLAAALHGEDIPQAYRSDEPWDGTLVFLGLHRRLREMEPGPARRELRDSLFLEAEDPGATCAGYPAGAQHHESTYFHIDYTNVPGPLEVEDYGASLDAAWAKEVGAFGWAAPPLLPNAPGGRYHVVLAPLGFTYGLTASSGTHAGFVGNNPSTPWNDQDAQASCIVLNDDYQVLAGLTGSTEQQVLDATTAHEFNHALQFGYGALNGSNLPDSVFIEGSATWVEDEVFDGSDDNYNYLWPDLADDMGSHAGSPYRYWVVFRAMTERFGTGVANGGERVMQRFWEITSKNEGDTLTAMGQALAPEGLTLADAFHDAAVALRFSRSCGGGYASPHCLEEGDQYVAAEGEPPVHGSIGGIGSRRPGSLPDNYSANWIDMPVGIGPVQVILANDSAQAGRFRGSVLCDTGTSLSVSPFTGVAQGGEHVYERSVSTGGCARATIVVTNVAETEANPSSSSSRPYALSVTPLADRSRTVLRGGPEKGRIEVHGRVRPRQRGGEVELTLFERRGKRWKKVKDREVDLKRGKRFEESFRLPDAARCRIEASFAGDDDHLPSTDRRTFSCSG
ncbi:MAG: hypothetical protein M3135_06225 [Actinomycetota bacterium]|nr:hypothetical protein [Actinomycetota bacterium]